jgi:hypothetical protein
MNLQMIKKYRLKMLIKINILASFLVYILFLFDFPTDDECGLLDYRSSNDQEI